MSSMFHVEHSVGSHKSPTATGRLPSGAGYAQTASFCARLRAGSIPACRVVCVSSPAGIYGAR